MARSVTLRLRKPLSLTLCERTIYTFTQSQTMKHLFAIFGTAFVLPVAIALTVPFLALGAYLFVQAPVPMILIFLALMYFGSKT